MLWHSLRTCLGIIGCLLSIVFSPCCTIIWLACWWGPGWSWNCLTYNKHRLHNSGAITGTKEVQNNLMSNKHYLASCNIPPKPLNNLVAALVDLKNPPHFNVNITPRYTNITDKNTVEEFFSASFKALAQIRKWNYSFKGLCNIFLVAYIVS